MTEPDTHGCAICGDDVEKFDGPVPVDDEGALYSGYNLELEEDTDAGYAICGGCSDHLGTRGDTFVVVMPRYSDDPEAGDIRTVSARVWDGIITTMYPGDRHDPIEPGTWEFDVVQSYVNGTDLPIDAVTHYEGVPEDSDGWEQIGTGWHSSLESSEVSERVNRLTSGEVGLYGPVLVKFGETRNVCSTSLTVYAPDDLTMWSREDHDRVPFREYLSGKTSAPGGAFGTS